jgi:transcription initiation factor TFIIB
MAKKKKQIKAKKVAEPSKFKEAKPVAGRVCPECGYTQTFTDTSRGEVYCARCGYVISDTIIDFSPERRGGDEEQRRARTRTGAPISPIKHDKGLTTQVGRSRGETQKVSPEKREQYGRLQKMQSRIGESKERNLQLALTELQRLVSYLGLPKSIHEQTAVKYEEAVNRGLVRGRSMESVIAALLYAVCREQGSPRTLEEIADASSIERREIGRAYRYVSRALKIRILPASAQDYIPRFASMLGLSEKVQAAAIRILNDPRVKSIISGKGPKGVAAAALYIAAVMGYEKRTQREIAEALAVTEVTIRNRFKELVSALGIEKEIDERIKELEE